VYQLVRRRECASLHRDNSPCSYPTRRDRGGRTRGALDARAACAVLRYKIKSPQGERRGVPRAGVPDSGGSVVTPWPSECFVRVLARRATRERHRLLASLRRVPARRGHRVRTGVASVDKRHSRAARSAIESRDDARSVLQWTTRTQSRRRGQCDAGWSTVTFTLGSSRQQGPGCYSPKRRANRAHERSKPVCVISEHLTRSERRVDQRARMMRYEREWRAARERAQRAIARLISWLSRVQWREHRLHRPTAPCFSSVTESSRTRASGGAWARRERTQAVMS
jgi:hypothetical protein